MNFRVGDVEISRLIWLKLPDAVVVHVLLLKYNLQSFVVIYERLAAVNTIIVLLSMFTVEENKVWNIFPSVRSLFYYYMECSSFLFLFSFFKRPFVTKMFITKQRKHSYVWALQLSRPKALLEEEYNARTHIHMRTRARTHTLARKRTSTHPTPHMYEIL